MTPLLQKPTCEYSHLIAKQWPASGKCLLQGPLSLQLNHQWSDLSSMRTVIWKDFKSFPQDIFILFFFYTVCSLVTKNCAYRWNLLLTLVGSCINIIPWWKELSYSAKYICPLYYGNMNLIILCETISILLLFHATWRRHMTSVQFSRSVMSNSLWPHGLQHARLPCPSPIPRAYSNSCPWWCYPTISSSVIPFSSHLQSFWASGSFPMSQFFASGGQSIGVSASASVLPMNI